jgi:hypothetical protein
MEIDQPNELIATVSGGRQMSLDFITYYGGQRLEGSNPLPEKWGDIPDEEEEREEVDLGIEIKPNAWNAITIETSNPWQPEHFPESPVRFVDGSDFGQTIAWIRSPEGYPIPIRLSQVGGVVMMLVNGELRRECEIVDRVVSMPVECFPWHEIEGFAAALRQNGLRFLPATPSSPEYLFDYQKTRRVVESRTREEMFTLEEAVLAQRTHVPTIVDGRLEPHSNGFHRATSPVFGVIKTHYKNYLHSLGIRLLYDLKAGQRTPSFLLQPEKRLSVVSWYIKLSDGFGLTPDWGYVRAEVSKEWFDTQEKDWDFINRISHAIYAYRHRENSYRRAAVSLHPIVRAEESLSALFSPSNTLIQRFYRMTQI